MAAGNSVPLTGGDRRKAPAADSRRPSGSSFQWSSSEPSSEEVAALEQLFPDVIQLPTVAIDQEIAEWTQLGLIVRCLSRWVPSEAVIRELHRGGIAGGISVIGLAHRTFLLKFELQAARDAVLSQPWIVNGQPLAAEVWHPGFIPAEDALHHALLWIRLPKLPIELWTDETLRAILSVAGQYVFMDSFTKEKRRGGYARACVRVNLSQPLRPGARFRATGSPFWQQFVYEHVDGICSLCGSIHLSGPCSSSKEAAGMDQSPSEMPRFGPWMSALRVRRPAPGENSSPLVRMDGSSGLAKSGHLEGEDGWMLPRKTARRRSAPSISPIVAVLPSATPPVLSVGPCREGVAVPVTVAEHLEAADVSDKAERSFKVPGSQSELQKSSKGHRKSQIRNAPKSPNQVENFQFAAIATVAMSELSPKSKEVSSGILSENPFGHLGSVRWAGCSKSQEDANPASLKRARPAVSAGPRVISKDAKGKTRGSSSGKAHSVALVPPSGSGPCRTNCDHDAMVSTLKKVIRAEEDAVTMDLSRQSDFVAHAGCPSSEDGLAAQGLVYGGQSDMELAGAKDGANVSP